MKQFKKLIYLFIVVALCAISYSVGHRKGKKQGFRKGIAYAMDSIIDYDNLTPESVGMVKMFSNFK